MSMLKLLMFRVSVMECGAFVEKIEADEDGQDGSSYAFALTTQSARFRISIIIKLAIISGVYGGLLNSLTTRSCSRVSRNVARREILIPPHFASIVKK